MDEIDNFLINGTKVRITNFNIISFSILLIFALVFRFVLILLDDNTLHKRVLCYTTCVKDSSVVFLVLLKIRSKN